MPEYKMLKLTHSELKFLEMLLQLNLNYILHNNLDDDLESKILEIHENYRILRKVTKELVLQKKNY